MLAPLVPDVAAERHQGRYADSHHRAWRRCEGSLRSCRVADIQETEGRWLTLGREAGFSRADVRYLAPNGLSRLRISL